MTSAAREGRVVLVDDDASTLSALRRLLRRERFDVATTLDPREAIAALERGDVRVLVTDQRMPCMRGTDVLRAAREASPATYRVLLTAYPDEEVIALRESGVIQRLLTKPWTDRDLRSLLRELTLGPEPPAECRLVVDGVVLRMTCASAGVDDAMELVAARLRRPEARRTGAIVVLESLPAAGREAMRILRALARHARVWGVATLVVDASGLAQACAGAPLMPVAGEAEARRRLFQRGRGEIE